MAKTIFIKRMYAMPDCNDGYRMLVDRIWSRGIKKEDAKLDEWNKEIAPPTELRIWFSHKAERFDEFAKQYKIYLSHKKDELERIKTIAAKKSVCLLYAAKDEKINHAAVLKKILNEFKMK